MYYSKSNLAYEIEVNTDKEVHEAPEKKKAGTGQVSGLLLFICVVYVISSITSLLFKTADVNESKNELNMIKSEYEAILNENKKLEVSNNSEIDLRKVENVAIAELNMNKPKNSQIVYISTNPVDYGEIITEETEAEGRGFLASAIKSFTGIFAYSN